MGHWKWGVLTLALLVALAVIGWWNILSGQPINLRWTWLCILVVLVALCVLAGYLVNGRLDGILIGNRNRISLERFQWTAWLIVLLSGYFAEVIWNTALGLRLPAIQTELLALLGIVSASPVASTLITGAKEQGATPRPSPRAAAAAVQPPPGASRDRPAEVGPMDANRKVEEASWADLYLGDEVADRYVVDISRLQQLVITVLLIVMYTSLLWRAFRAPAGALDMPQVSETFVWLLGISHASYLAYKAVPKKPTG